MTGSIVKFVFLGALSTSLALEALAETLYVQSQKIVLKAEPKTDSAEVDTLTRGTELTQLESQGSWLKVQKGDKSGWVSKFFVNKNKPIGAASLAEDMPTSEAKTSRRRESAYSVSASSRGLMPVERSRSGREAYRSDNRALEAVEKLNLPAEEVERFIQQAQAGKK